MKNLCIMVSILLLAGCGRGGAPSQAITYTQESGFVDVQICGIDIHMDETGQVYVCGGSPYSQTSNAGYTPATDGTVNLTMNGVPCSFQVQGGQLVGNTWVFPKPVVK